MRASHRYLSPGLDATGVGWLITVPLFLLALGIPLDVLIASRIGSTSLVLGAPLVAIVCWHVLATNRLRRLSTPLVLAVGFAAWGAASILWARDQDLLLTRMITNAQLLAFVLLCWQLLDTERAISVVIGGFVAGCLGVVGGVWLAFLSGQAVGAQMYEGGTRFAAEGFDPNDMGTTLAIGIPMAAYLAVSGKWLGSHLALGYLPLAWSAIVLSGSRGSSITALVAATGVLLWFGARSRYAFALVLAVLAAGLALAWQVVPWDTWARLFTLREQLAGDGTAGDRTPIWRAGLEVLARNPVLGVGAGGFPDSIASVLGKRLVAHSTLLSVAVELGIIGLLLYGSAFGAALLGVLRQTEDRRDFGLTLLATLLVGSASLSWEHRKTTWLVLLLCTALAPMHSALDHRNAACSE